VPVATWTAAALLLAGAAPLAAPGLQAQAGAPAGSRIQITWLGHAAFEIVSPGGTRLLIDPWISANPYTPAAFKDTTRYAAGPTRPAGILVTHAHADHASDVPQLARLSGAAVVATGDHLEAMKIPESQIRSINLGGRQQIGDVTIHAVPAMHSSEPGRALGYVLRFADGRTIYHTGDTWVFGDMALIEQFHHPSIILIAAGGGRAGEDPDAAAFVVRTYFHPQVVVPMHYGNAVLPLATEQEVRAAFKGDPRLRVLVPGVTTAF
jgi:L-ascorbate metabolism protein UlaG (beta-lactamase superfamily)